MNRVLRKLRRAASIAVDKVVRGMTSLDHRLDSCVGTDVTGELRNDVVKISARKQLVEQCLFFDLEVVTSQNIRHKYTLH